MFNEKTNGSVETSLSSTTKGRFHNALRRVRIISIHVEPQFKQVLEYIHPVIFRPPAKMESLPSVL
ncbi:uncharacterized protein ACHE_51142A [Aspergillus chevalieri]|uniref:Uncharacterized protein n=1 Tax=Aspergillus chevalieri TaxID=182096 RepID=A0A7R7ZQS8_ASPCH|nr:uncharacterized protein ACHE_51142A [Aspergillus chevalieri]BCR89944.1 hypothetical protein ACHE_51142A [Aspergillus chevalieri]